MVKRLVLTWLAKWALKRLQTRMEVVKEKQAEVDAVLRGTATKPVYVGSVYDPNVYRATYEQMDHVHAWEGVCLKNRFGTRCPDTRRHEYDDSEDWGANSIFGMG